jgi:hypothetical protein
MLVAVLVVVTSSSRSFASFAPPDENDVYVMTEPEVPLEETAKTYAAMKPVAYQPPTDRWTFLPRTREVLKNGGDLRIVMLGDSIVNDTARSNWTFHLQGQYPKVKIVKYTVVRGSTGCDWYAAPGRVKRYVLDFKPTLVMIGGISHKEDVDAIRDVIRQIRKGCDADVLVMTGPIGYADPYDDKQWAEISRPAGTSYAARLARLAKDEKVEFVDLRKAWADYVRGSGRPVAAFKRDAVHANREGELVVGRILMRYFGTDR